MTQSLCLYNSATERKARFARVCLALGPLIFPSYYRALGAVGAVFFLLFSSSIWLILAKCVISSARG